MHDAITSSEFSNLLCAVFPVASPKPGPKSSPKSDLKYGSGIAAAVSGGADSLALTLLLGQWCKSNDVALTALTVDHGLRPEAKDEALQIGRWLKKYDIRHVVLNWQGAKPSRNIQDRARIARYQLMGKWCQNNDVDNLFLGHHEGDQAETFLIRLFRGSGVDGLSAMREISDFPVPLARRGNVHLCRPLLTVTKKRLEATLRQMNQPWIEDPSNQNENYTRIKVRKLLRDSEIEGLNAQRMAQTAARMGRVQSLLQAMTAGLTQEAVTVYPEGYMQVNMAKLMSAHEEIALRCLSSLVKKMSGSRYIPRFSRVEALYNNLKQVDFPGQTLGGCLVSSIKATSGTDHIIISREIAAIEHKIDLENCVPYLWDQRFEIDNIGGARLVKKLELAEWRRLCSDYPDLKKLKLPKKILYSLPCMILMNGDVILPNFIPGFEEKGFKAIFRSGYEKNGLDMKKTGWI